MARRYFHAHETACADELEGLPLAGFGRRVLGYLIDLLIVILLWVPFDLFWVRYVNHEWTGQSDYRATFDFHEWRNIVAALVYFVLVNFLSNGRSLGKWIAGTRVVSLKGRRLSLWQCIERVLGYGASTAEAGLGFIQYFFSPNRMCSHDRLAETIVVDVRKKAQMKKADSQARDVMKEMEQEQLTDENPTAARKDGATDAMVPSVGDH